MTEHTQQRVMMRVVIASHDRAIRTIMRERLFAAQDFKIVAECTDGREILNAIPSGGIDVVIAEMPLPNHSDFALFYSMLETKYPFDEPWKGEARGEEPAVAAADGARRSLRSQVRVRAAA